MGNIRYHLSGEQSGGNPVRLLYISSSIYEGDWPSILHTHYFSELFYVISGAGSFVVEDHTFPLVQDDLVIVNPHVAHTEVSISSTPLEYVVLGVEGMQFAFDEHGEVDHTSCNYLKQRDELLFYFNAMVKEIETKADGHEIICQKLLDILLIIITRDSRNSF